MNSLEEVLQLLGSETPFLDDSECDEDKYSETFTESGSKAYGKLTDILYAVGNLTGVDVEDIVENWTVLRHKNGGFTDEQCQISLPER